MDDLGDVQECTEAIKEYINSAYLILADVPQMNNQSENGSDKLNMHS